MLKNFSSSRSIATCLRSVGHSMPRDSSVVPIMQVDAITEALREHLQGADSHALHCPKAALAAGVVSCTYHQWFKSFSKLKRRRCCQLPVSGRPMSHVKAAFNGTFALTVEHSADSRFENC